MGVTSTHFTALRATGVWRQPLAWLVPTSVFSAGGEFFTGFLQASDREFEISLFDLIFIHL